MAVRLTGDLWDPPEGMRSSVVASWRAFYRRASSGDAGYIIRPSEYRRLYIAQKGRCWICRKAKGIHPDDPKGYGSRRLGVDHDHLTGQIRGLLCTGGDKTCNRIIGWLDGPALQRAAAYRSTRAGQPARVLDVIGEADSQARAEGVTLTDDQLDVLAIAFLWDR